METVANINPLGWTRVHELFRDGQKVLPYGISTFYAKSRVGKAPAVHRLGPRTAAIRNADLLAYLKDPLNYRAESQTPLDYRAPARAAASRSSTIARRKITKAASR